MWGPGESSSGKAAQDGLSKVSMRLMHEGLVTRVVPILMHVWAIRFLLHGWQWITAAGLLLVLFCAVLTFGGVLVHLTVTCCEGASSKVALDRPPK